MIRIWSIVEWDAASGDVERGILVAARGPWATVQHGWRADLFDVPLSMLRPWDREEVP
jgi:hypothetical protein